MKTYSRASDEVFRTIEKMVAANYDPTRKAIEPENNLLNVTIGALFIFNPEVTATQVLTHGGYPAAAMIKVTNLRDRAAGLPDAMIVIDRACWLSMKQEKCHALIDHELYHLVREIDEDSGKPAADALDRPKLSTRKHDHQFGWFDEIAMRHGVNSFEVIQARSLLSEAGQLYFDFSASPGAGPLSPPPMAAGPDELLDVATDYVRMGHTTVSRVQLRFGIGFNRAMRLMEAMEADGVLVRPSTGRTGEWQLVEPQPA